MTGFNAVRLGLLLAGCAAILGSKCHERECFTQDAEATGECTMSLGFRMGECNHCEELIGCNCKGDDCDELFSSRDECVEFVGDAVCCTK
jgi:hypothetical protein